MDGNYLKMKEEFIAIDILKFFAALLVVSIHVPPFYDYNFEVSFWMKNVLSAIAVPFFFMASGYFCAEKMENEKKV